MFELMVFVLIMSFYISLAIAIVMFGIRVYLGMKVGTNWKETLSIICMPLGFGVFLYVKHPTWLKIYRILIVVLLVFSIVASLFLFHRELGL